MEGGASIMPPRLSIQSAVIWTVFVSIVFLAQGRHGQRWIGGVHAHPEEGTPGMARAPPPACWDRPGCPWPIAVDDVLIGQRRIVTSIECRPRSARLVALGAIGIQIRAGPLL